MRFKGGIRINLIGKDMTSSKDGATMSIKGGITIS